MLIYIILILIPLSFILGIFAINEIIYLFILVFIFIINQIVLLVLVPLYKSNIKIFQFLKIMSFCLLIISFIKGIFINISVWMTSAEGDSFLRYCPYHYDYFLLSKIIDKYSTKNENNNHKKFKLCDMKLCYFYSENEENSLAFNYICNYDSSKDFNHKNGKVHKKINSNGKEVISNIYITCTKKLKIPPSDKNLITYYNLCHNLLYLCELFEKPKEKDFTSINNLESCPGLDYTKSAFLLSLSYLLIDLICFSFFYFIEFLILRKIEHLLQNNINHLKNNSTINSTNNKNKQMSNIENKEEFKKDETSFIIVENNQQKGPIIEIKKKEISDSKISTILKIENNEKELEFRHKKVKNLKVSNSSRLQLINLNVLENEEKKDEKENNNSFIIISKLIKIKKIRTKKY